MGSSGSSASKVSRAAGGNLELVRRHINDHKVLMYTKTTCPKSTQAKTLFDKGEVPYHEVNLEKVENANNIKTALKEVIGNANTPNIFINHKHIGGYEELQKKHDSGELKDLLNQANIRHIF